MTTSVQRPSMRRGASARGDTGVMITPDDIARLANEGESEMLEFKSTTGSRVSAAQTLSAMLNGQGGRVLFGVRPDGRVVGQHVSDNTLQLVTQACREHSSPASTLDRARSPAECQRARSAGRRGPRWQQQAVLPQGELLHAIWVIDGGDARPDPSDIDA